MDDTQPANAPDSVPTTDPDTLTDTLTDALADIAAAKQAPRPLDFRTREEAGDAAKRWPAMPEHARFLPIEKGQYVTNPARQQKAQWRRFGLSGRQLVRFRKAIQRKDEDAVRRILEAAAKRRTR